MVNMLEQSAIVAAAAAEPGVERGRLGGAAGGRLAEESSDEEEGSQCFSDDDRSWHSYSRQDSAALEDDISTCGSVRFGAGTGDEEGEGAAGRGRKSCMSECSLDDVDLEAGLAEITKASPDKAERNCRICHFG